jgi:hypothetical protein
MEPRFLWGWIAPYYPHPDFKGPGTGTCFMCGSDNCHESMPHGNHPDWLAFVEMHGPDPFGKKAA